MKDSDIAKIGRLRDGESSEDEATNEVIRAEEPIFRLRVLDERLEADERRLLDDLNRRILDQAMELHGIKHGAIASALGVDRSTVWRRAKQLRTDYVELSTKAKVLLGQLPMRRLEGEVNVKLFFNMLKTALWGGIGPKPPGAMDPKEYNTAARYHRAVSEARDQLYPLSYVVEHKGGKV